MMIELYSKPGCVHCDSAKTWLTENAFEFKTIDITQNPAALDFVVKNGHRTVPQIYREDGTILVAGGYAGLNKLTAGDLRTKLT